MFVDNSCFPPLYLPIYLKSASKYCQGLQQDRKKNLCLQLHVSDTTQDYPENA